MKKLQGEEKAKYYAIAAHGTQEYDGLPYVYHLEEVVSILKEFGFKKRNTFIAGYLHDVLEDCPVSFNDIKNEFGAEVAEAVYCVTDELGRNRKERKLKTYPKIASNRLAVIIKLADRIANIRNSGSLLDMYIKEFPDFKSALYYPHYTDFRIQRMWDELEKLINA